MGIKNLELPTVMRNALRECRPHFLGVFGFSALVNILYLAPTLYMMQVYDRVVPTGGVLTLVWLTIILGMAIATLTFLDGIRSRIMVRAALRLNETLSGPIFAKLLAETRGNKTAGGNAQVLREFDTVRQAITGPAMMAAVDIPWIPVYLIAAFLLHPLMALLIVLGGAVLIALAVVNERTARNVSREGHSANNAAYALQEAMNSRAEVIRALGMTSPITMRQQNMRLKGLEVTANGQLNASKYTVLVKFVRMFLQSLSLGLAAWLAVNGQISSGSIIAASVLLSRALQPIEQLVGAWPIVIAGQQAFGSLVDLLRDSDNTRRLMQLPEPAGELSFLKVERRNPQGTQAIVTDISFALKPGEVTAFIGPSGAGKSTIARVACGAIRADEGEVRIDGAKLGDWDPEQLACHFGYLPQDCALLPGTIAENISRFASDRGEAPGEVDEAVISAAKLAGIHQLILKLPDGYNARLGTPDFALSGGQAQRIALARALYGDPKILILDEPGSALDGDGEQNLMQVIAHAKARRATVMIISHRSQLLNVVDRLIILQDGRLVSDGPRDVVIKKLQDAAAREREKVVSLNRANQNG